jgi:hypothetical protein
MKAVVILDDTIEDIAAGREFYEERATRLGDYFGSSILNDVASLGDLHGFHSRRYNYFWMLATKFPFGIYYAISEERVEVHADLDQRERPSPTRRKPQKRS